ncbi:MAG: hypothetical protein QG597_2237 [Actinomycetota bacterium]|nr:hypothetical protein [Actinomycetota bacterium]
MPKATRMAGESSRVAPPSEGRHRSQRRAPAAVLILPTRVKAVRQPSGEFARGRRDQIRLKDCSARPDPVNEIHPP